MLVKALGLPEVTQCGLCSEIFGNLLARELGIATPRPGLVELSSSFIAAIAPVLKSRQLDPQPGLAAGCEYLRGLASVVPGASLTPPELAQAALIYGFDLLVQNIDRRPEKPNCAQHRGGFIAYDFELAFSFLRLIGEKDEPWEVSKHGIGTKHLFYSSLQSAAVDWQPFLTAISRLTDERLDELGSDLPEPWQPWTIRVREHLVAVRMHLSEFEWELRRSLA
jgi:hypothetical protein